MTTTKPRWRIECEPQGRNVNDPNTDKNLGGLVIYLQKYSDVGYTDGTRQEVNRVAFDRSQSANPRSQFQAQVDKEIAKAVKAAEILNTDLMGDGTLQ